MPVLSRNMAIIRSVAQWSFLALWAGLLGLWAFSLAGSLHPLGDSLAVFRFPIVLAMIPLGALMLVLRLRGALVVVLAGVLLSALVFTHYTARNVTPETPDVVVYSKNLLAGVTDIEPVIRDIHAVKADLVLLQEVSIHNRHILEGLSTRFPHQHLCPFSNWSGMAVVSRWPLEGGACSRFRTLATAQVMAPFGSFQAGSVHLLWPYPYNQTRILNETMPMLNAMKGSPVVLGGDFNMVPWSHTMRRIAGATGAVEVGPVWNTISLKGLPLPIDHVLSSGTGRTERRALLGSDHHGLVARIGF